MVHNLKNPLAFAYAFENLENGEPPPRPPRTSPAAATPADPPLAPRGPPARQRPLARGVGSIPYDDNACKHHVYGAALKDAETQAREDAERPSKLWDAAARGKSAYLAGQFHVHLQAALHAAHRSCPRCNKQRIAAQMMHTASRHCKNLAPQPCLDRIREEKH